MLRVLLAALLSFASLASASASWTEVRPTESASWWDITSSSDGTKLAATVRGGNIWTSTDSGETWTSRASTQNWHGITSSSDGTKLAAVVWDGNIWTSTDYGASWNEVKPTESTTWTWRSITSSSDGIKLAAVVQGGNIWTSTDFGETWTSRASPGKWRDITSSSDGTKLAATVYNGNIWTSWDSGETWTSRATTQIWEGITSSSDGTKLAAVVQGGNIWTSTDSGETWTSRASTQIWWHITSSSDGTKLAAVAYSSSGNIWTSTDSGETWTSRASTQNWYSITSSSHGTKLAAVVSGGNIWTYRTPVCDENSHVSNGACVPCGPGASRAQGDLIDGGDTECACVKDYYVSNGACVACDPALGRAPGDLPSNGDTECECKCKARTRAWGFTMSDSQDKGFISTSSTWSNSTRPFDPPIGTRGRNTDRGRDELFTENGWIDASTEESLMDGSSETLYATSALKLRSEFPSLGDGLYHYKIPGTTTIRALFTDMTRNGGGWVVVSKWGGHSKTDEKIYDTAERQLTVLQSDDYGSLSDYARLSREHMNRIWAASQFICRIHHWSGDYQTTSGVYFQNKLTEASTMDFWKAHYHPLYWSDWNKNTYQAIGGGTNYGVIFDFHHARNKLSDYDGSSSAFDPNAAKGTKDQIKSSGGRQEGRNANMAFWDDWKYSGDYGPGGDWNAARHMGFFVDISQGVQWIFTNNPAESRWGTDENRLSMVFLRW